MKLRVLLATDLSASATIAARLVAAQRWPEATTIRVFGVLEPSHGTAHDDGDAGACAFTTGVRASAETLVARGRIIEAATDLGHPADVIVDEATRFRADLVVLGSRGRGLIRSAVLGSVSARVADEAPCPVLIARHEEISGVVFGDDGATYTAEAARVLTWPAFAALPITVVSVAEVYLPFQAVAETRARFEDSVRTYLQESHDREERCQRTASEQAAALIRLGIKAKGEMPRLTREGAHRSRRRPRSRPDPRGKPRQPRCAADAGREHGPRAPLPRAVLGPDRSGCSGRAAGRRSARSGVASFGPGGMTVAVVNTVRASAAGGGNGRGLQTAEAVTRLATFGPNELLKPSVE